MAGDGLDRHAVVDQNGRFTSGYVYSPQVIQVEMGKILEINVSLVPETTRANDPVVKQVGFFPWEARQGRVTFVKMEVSDPTHDLGPPDDGAERGDRKVR